MNETSAALPSPASYVPRHLDEEADTATAPPVAACLHLAAALLDQYGVAAPTGTPLLDVVVDGYRWTVTRCAPAPAAIHRLSPREREIVRMVAQGLTNRAIASTLEISPWTVGTHLRRIFGKLEVNSRAAMVALAIENGLRPATGPERDTSA